VSLDRALEAIRGRRILILGEAILDAYVQGHVSRLCREAPVPILDAETRVDAPGGAANTAANVRSLGGVPVFVSALGADGEGERLRESLVATGVDDRHVLGVSARPTLAKQRLLAGEQLLLRFDSGSTAPLDDRSAAALVAALREAHADADAVVVSDYGYGVITPVVREALFRLQARRPLPLIVDARDLRAWAPGRPSAVKPNYAEATRLLGLAELHQRDERVDQVAAEGFRLLELTAARIVALTLDRDGSIAFEQGRPPYRTFARPAATARAAGAGDTFTAMLGLGLAADLETPDMLELASAATGVVVTRDGTSTCGFEEVAAAVATVRGKRLEDGHAVARWAARARGQGRRIVFTNGCFDIIHRGHVAYLNRAKALGDVLVVAVNDDASVRRLKGRERPINSLDDRIGVLEALSCIDAVVPFGEDTPASLIEAVRPDVFVKGGDYRLDELPEAPLVERLGGEVQLLPLVPDHSTTRIVQRVRAGSEARTAGRPRAGTGRPARRPVQREARPARTA
jgi:D-beta-D-heptose 7-phosphate kinase / D-beta-D-heptose 1-phosphate adenosyltransferase